MRRVSDWFLTYGFADVYDGLVIGAYPLDLADVEMLRRMSIGLVLNVVDDVEYPPAARDAVEAALAGYGIPERRLALDDFGRLPAPIIDAAVQDVCASLDAGESVYLHCRAGRQRSAALAAAVITVREGVGIDEALARVRVMRRAAEPLPHQREDLLAWWRQRSNVVAD
jgi:protein-tyrosine phosphatase